MIDDERGSVEMAVCSVDGGGGWEHGIVFVPCC